MRIRSPVLLSYQFGGGEIEKAQDRVILTLGFLPKGKQQVTFSVVGSTAANLPPLLGREYLDQTGAVLDFKNAQMMMSDEQNVEHIIQLQNTKQGRLGHALTAQLADCGNCFPNM